MDPVDIIPEAVAAVHDDGPPGTRDLLRDLPPTAIQERRADHVAAEWPRYPVPDHVRMGRQRTCAVVPLDAVVPRKSTQLPDRVHWRCPGTSRASSISPEASRTASSPPSPCAT